MVVEVVDVVVNNFYKVWWMKGDEEVVKIVDPPCVDRSSTGHLPFVDRSTDVLGLNLRERWRGKWEFWGLSV